MIFSRYSRRDQILLLHLLMLDISSQPVKEKDRPSRVEHAINLAIHLGFSKTEAILKGYKETMYYKQLPVRIEHLSYNFEEHGGHLGMAKIHHYKMPLIHHHLHDQRLIQEIMVQLVEPSVWFEDGVTGVED